VTVFPTISAPVICPIARIEMTVVTLRYFQARKRLLTPKCTFEICRPEDVGSIFLRKVGIFLPN